MKPRNISMSLQKISELTHDGKSFVRACIFAGTVHNNAVSGEL